MVLVATTPVPKQDIKELQDTYYETVKLRKSVLDWQEKYGYNANDLVSRTAEHDMEMFYGRLALGENIERN